MKKISIVLVLTLLLVGCGNGKEASSSKESSAYQLKFEDYMNCYRLFYKESDGTGYYTTAGTIKIKFDNTDWMNIEQAFEDSKITIENFIKKEKDSFKKCEPTDSEYPCNSYCDMLN